jgi:hypothetical protein
MVEYVNIMGRSHFDQCAFTGWRGVGDLTEIVILEVVILSAAKDLGRNALLARSFAALRMTGVSAQDDGQIHAG